MKLVIIKIVIVRSLTNDLFEILYAKVLQASHCSARCRLLYKTDHLEVIQRASRHFLSQSFLFKDMIYQKRCMDVL